MMSRSEMDDSLDPLDIEAVDWVVRLTAGRPARGDWQEFERWQATSPAHARAFAAACELCGHFRNMPLSTDDDSLAGSVSDEQRREIVAFPHVQRQKDLSRRGFLGGAIAASLAGGLMIVDPPLKLWPSLAELMADRRTGAGEQKSFSPVAGVNVELNSRSSVSKTLDGDGLDLIAGEAFVSVDDRPHPYRVTAKETTIAADRASFNVSLLGDQLCLTCTAGSITVGRGSFSEPLGVGYELVFDGDSQVPRKASADEHVRLAWRRGLLIFQRTPVAEAILQINRHYPGRLVLTAKSKADWPVSGTFHIDQIELAVVQLEHLLDVNATHLAGGVVLLG